jgi:hypothetical protein
VADSTRLLLEFEPNGLSHFDGDALASQKSGCKAQLGGFLSRYIKVCARLHYNMRKILLVIAKQLCN